MTDPDTARNDFVAWLKKALDWLEGTENGEVVSPPPGVTDL